MTNLWGTDCIFIQYDAKKLIPSFIEKIKLIKKTGVKLKCCSFLCVFTGRGDVSRISGWPRLEKKFSFHVRRYTEIHAVKQLSPQYNINYYNIQPVIILWFKLSTIINCRKHQIAAADKFYLAHRYKKK